MNKERRMKIATVIKNLEIEVENVNTIRGDLTQIKSDIAELCSAEERVLDSMEDKWSETSRYASCEESLDKLDDARSDMSSLLNTLQKIEETINEIVDELNDATYC